MFSLYMPQIHNHTLNLRNTFSYFYFYIYDTFRRWKLYRHTQNDVGKVDLNQNTKYNQKCFHSNLLLLSTYTNSKSILNYFDIQRTEIENFADLVFVWYE